MGKQPSLEQIELENRVAQLEDTLDKIQAYCDKIQAYCDSQIRAGEHATQIAEQLGHSDMRDKFDCRRRALQSVLHILSST